MAENPQNVPKIGFGDKDRGNSFLASKTIIICFRSQNTSIRMFFTNLVYRAEKTPVTASTKRAAISISYSPARAASLLPV